MASNTVWRYFDAGFHPGTNWAQPVFNDITWKFGAAKLGFGNLDDATVLDRAASGSPLIAAYFRHQFTLPNASLVTSLQMKLWRDDGAIVYVNGVEVFRNNMPAGSPTYFTLATSAITGPAVPLVTALPSGLLVNGVNTIAVEVHQVNATSSDLAFALELTSNVDSPPNQAPLTGVMLVPVPANGSRSFTLIASDPDGDPLFFQTQPPQHGAVSGSGASVVYTPAPGYVGPDMFFYVVTDGQALATGTVSLVVQVVNQAPIAVATVSPISNPSYKATGLTLIAANNQNVNVILDGTASSDPDGDPLTHAWSIVGGTPFSTQPMLTRSFDVGLWGIALQVSDGTDASVAYVAVEVKTPCQALEKMKIDISAEPGMPARDGAHLDGILDDACEFFSRGKPKQGVQRIEHFQKEVQKRLGKSFPFFAGDLIESAQFILDAFN